MGCRNSQVTSGWLLAFFHVCAKLLHPVPVFGSLWRAVFTYSFISLVADV